MGAAVPTDAQGGPPSFLPHTPEPSGGWGTPAELESPVPWGTSEKNEVALYCRPHLCSMEILKKNLDALPLVFIHIIFSFLLDAGELVTTHWDDELLPEKSKWVMPMQYWGEVSVPRLVNLLLTDDCVFFWGIIRFAGTLNAWKMAVKTYTEAYGQWGDSEPLKDVGRYCIMGDKRAVDTILGRADRDFNRFLLGLDVIMQDLDLVT